MDQNNFFIPDLDIEQLPGAATTKDLHLIFIADNSGSMRMKAGNGQSRMDAVNAAFRDMVANLQTLQADVKSSFTMYISIMVFNEDPTWHTYKQEIAGYVFNDIPASPYVTYYSRAYEELNKQLSQSALLAHTGKIAKPYIMLMTDGAPSEGDDYETPLNELKTVNGWFEVALRYAVLIGEDTVNDPAARAAVAGFVRDPREGIIDAVDAAEIAKAVSASTQHNVENMTKRNKIGSGSGTSGEVNGQTPDFMDFWNQKNPYGPTGAGNNVIF